MTAPAEFDPRFWAAGLLEVPPDAPRETIRAALRRRLAEDDFVPPEQVGQAVEVLLRSDEPSRGKLARAQAQLEEEQRLRAEIDDFAGEFFDLPPEKRQLRWQALWTAGKFSPLLTARLRALGPGLKVSRPENLSPDVAALAQHVCNLFVLRPAARAALRQDLLNRMKGKTNDQANRGENPWRTVVIHADSQRSREEINRWQTAAHCLKRHAPAVAGLMGEFVEFIACRESWLKQKTKAKRTVARLAAVPAGKSSMVLKIIVFFTFLRVIIAVIEHTTPVAPPPPKPIFPRFEPLDIEKIERQQKAAKKRWDEKFRQLPEEERRKFQKPFQLKPGPDEKKPPPAVPSNPPTSAPP